MADLPLLTARINLGLGIAASIVGRPVSQFRPQNPLSPLNASAQVGTLMAAFDSEASLDLKQPELIGRSLFYMLADGTGLQIGDYLMNSAGTYFVASMEDLRPPVVLRTNSTLSLVRPVTGATAGLNPPGADSLSTELTIFSGWPASVLIAGKGEPGDVALAGDLRMGGWQVLLPAISNIDIRGSDILVDQTGLRRVVTSAESGPMGWRIEAQQEAS